MNNIKSHDAYIAQSAEQLRPSLASLRKQLRDILPNAEEIIAYNMPGFNIGKDTIIGYAGFSKQGGVYVSHDAIDLLREELVAAGFEPTKMGVKFTPSKPIPNDLLKKLIQASKKSLGH